MLFSALGLICALISGSEPLATSGSIVIPNNDNCANAVTITCNQGDNNNISGAGDASQDLNKHAGGERNGDTLRDVYYLLDVPPGMWKVTVKMIGLAGADIDEAQLSMAATNQAQFCDGPFSHYKRTSCPEDDKELNEGESLEITQECLLGGKYLIELACDANPTEANGAYRIEVTCLPWQAPPPGDAKSKKADGSDEVSFPVGDDVYVGGSLTADVFNDVFVIVSQNLSDQQPIPDPVSGTALFVATNGAGQPIFSDLEFHGRSQDSPGSPDPNAPALVWPHARAGSYKVVIDRDGDGLFDAGIDVITPTFHVQGGGTVPLMDGPIWFGALVLTVLAGAAYVLKNR